VREIGTRFEQNKSAFPSFPSGDGMDNRQYRLAGLDHFCTKVAEKGQGGRTVFRAYVVLNIWDLQEE
jgi:hypothetical protein